MAYLRRGCATSPIGNARKKNCRNAKRAAETANSHKSDFLARVSSRKSGTRSRHHSGFPKMMAEERFGPIRGSPRAYLEIRPLEHREIPASMCSNIVNDLLDISKIEAGQVSMEVCLGSRLNDHLAEKRVAVAADGQQPARDHPAPACRRVLPEVGCRPAARIKQIRVLNLLSNAIRYTPCVWARSLGVDLL